MGSIEPMERSLAALERIIERGMSSFVEVGNALSEIRDEKKYRAGGYRDFDTYCRERWGFSRYRGFQMIEAATITNELLTIVNTPAPVRESQVRELARVEPDRRAEVWEAAIEKHGPHPTAKEVRAVADAETNALIANVVDGPSFDDARLRLTLLSELRHLNGLIQLKPDAIGLVLEQTDEVLLRAHIQLARQWMDDVEKAMQRRGFRVVG